MGGKAKTPKAPDYKALAVQQADLQNQQLQAQTVANRPTQVNPYGSIEWEQDPDTGAWTQVETWDPEIQGLMDKYLGMQTTQADELAAQGSFSGGPALPTYDPTTGQAYGRTFTDSLLARVRPQQALDQQAMETKLRLQGLQPGTEAYDRAYQNLLTSQGDVNAQAELQGMLAGQKHAIDMYNTQLGGQQQGYNQSLQNYLLPWQKAAATQGLASGVPRPDFQGFAASGMGQGTDVMGSAQQQYAQQMQQYNEKAAKKQSKGSSIGAVVGGVAGAFVGMPQVGAALGGAAGGAIASDERVKENIAQISDEECYNLMCKLLPISWRWSGTSIEDMGISAQQVLELAPELIVRGEKGLLRVNYTGLFARLLGAFRHMAKLQGGVERAA